METNIEWQWSCFCHNKYKWNDQVLPPKTAEEVVARERERKIRSTLLMALPEDHLAKFHKMDDAKEMWEAIKSRFGGNDESKKMQKYLLKQHFEGFSVSISEGLHKGYDSVIIALEDPISKVFNKWYQSLVRNFDLQENHFQSTSLSLSIHNKKWINKILPLPKYKSWTQENSSNGSSGYNNIFNMNIMPCGSKYKTTQELWAAILKTFGGNEATKKTKKNLLKKQYGNFKAEGSETLEQTFNRLSDLDTMSLDDLYNHLKVYESEVQKKSKPNSQNMAFISSAKHSRGNEDVNPASVSTASTIVPTASANNEIDEDDMEDMDIKWSMALLSMRADKFWKKTGKKISIQGSDVAGFNKLKDWSYMANDKEDHALVADKEAPIEFALMANTSPESMVFDNSLCFKDCKKNDDSLNSKITDLTDKLFDAKNMIYHYKLRLAQVESRLVEHKEREIKYCEKIKGLELDVNFNTNKFECIAKELETLKKEKEGKISTGGIKFSTADMGKKGKAGSSQNNIDDKGYWDSNCSRYMTGNISYLSDYEPFDGGYVSFGQGGCKITGKGTIKIECIVLGRDFKLLDDANILLRTPRQHNMYSIDLNNIVPYKDLTCLVVKASADECMLWHRRL
nr:ribonuclease H-like domain-containing protein [Tanacetum cinerariifolium]